jgi:hypothetical protein
VAADAVVAGQRPAELDDGNLERRAFFEFAEREADRYTFERILTVSDGAVAIRVRVRR